MSLRFNSSNISMLSKIVLLDVPHRMQKGLPLSFRCELLFDENSVPAVFILKDHFPDSFPEVYQLYIYIHP